jgi:hypothetical protein
MVAIPAADPIRRARAMRRAGGVRHAVEIVSRARTRHLRPEPLGRRWRFPDRTKQMEATMGRGLLLWLIGIPLPIILLVWLLGGLS